MGSSRESSECVGEPTLAPVAEPLNADFNHRLRAGAVQASASGICMLRTVQFHEGARGEVLTGVQNPRLEGQTLNAQPDEMMTSEDESDDEVTS